VRREGVPEPRLADCELPAVRVQVEGPALVACVRGRVVFVHCEGDLVPLQDVGEGEARGAGADDCDFGEGRHDFDEF